MKDPGHVEEPINDALKLGEGGEDEWGQALFKIM